MLNFDIINRTIQTPPQLIDVVVKGDTNSKTIVFSINRYFDGVDLAEKTIQVCYINNDGGSNYEDCQLKEYTLDKLFFSWKMRSGSTSVAGQLHISVEFSSLDENGEKEYIWRTKSAIFNVENSFTVLRNTTQEDYSQQMLFYANNASVNNTAISDSSEPIQIVNRRILMLPNEDIVMSGDTRSQIISFTLPRYIENVDFSQKCIAIKFVNAKSQSDRCPASNIVVTNTTITFGWLLDSKVTLKDGYVNFAIEFFGYDEYAKFTVWQTATAQLPVSKGLFVDGSIDEPEPSWLQFWQMEKEQFLADVGTGGSSINDTTPSNATTYSSSKIESLLSEIANPLTASLSINPSVVELGGSITPVVLSWTYNKNVDSQTIDGITIDPSLRSYNYTTPLVTNKTFTLNSTTASGSTATKTATLNFYNGVYYGKSTSVIYDGNLIQSLTKVLSNSKSRTISVTANAGEYIYYCLPSRLGLPTFAVDGFSGGFSKVVSISFTNSSNYVETYDVYKSDNSNLGNTTVLVS